MSVLISILGALTVLTVLVIIHEGGHYIMGKILGFRILEFSIGMGPKLFSKEKNGTVFSVRAFPIGGMCAFDGEDEEAASEGSFNSFPAWKRLLVALAGPFMNIVAGFLLAAILLLIFGQVKSVNLSKPMLGTINEKSPAATAGLLPGDIVIKVNDKSIETSSEMIELIRKDNDGNINLTVLRPTESSQYTVNGKTVSHDDLSDFSSFAKENPADEYIASVTNTEEISITVKDAYNKEAGYNVIGASVSESLVTFEEKYNAVTCIPAGFDFSVYVVDTMFDFLGNIFKGEVSANDVSGIVGVVDVVNDGVSTVMEDTEYNAPTKTSIIFELMFYIAVLLSLNLGIINLLPLPALDGGRIVFNTIEIIARKPIPAKVEGMIHAVGLILLLILIALITVKDVFMLFR